MDVGARVQGTTCAQVVAAGGGERGLDVMMPVCDEQRICLCGIEVRRAA